MTCNEESTLLGLCLSCNEAKGYKKVNYTIVLTDFYDCILNTSSKLNKYFLNEDTNDYRPCYKTCKKCSKGGDEYANNCLECETGYMFRPGDNPYNNCVVYSEHYYINPYNQYKALDSLQCPEESKYVVMNGDKSFCIYDCKADETYKYLYNGVCLKQCPENTNIDNYICKEIVDECILGENKMDPNHIVNEETTKILVETFISEFNYTKNHVTLHTNQDYTIIIYENRECVIELSLEMPKVDFKDCYEKVKNEYNIDEELIIVIINKKDKNGGQTFYSFYHPIYGYKLNAEEICKNETIVVKENLTAILSELSESSEYFELQTFLTDQGINIFDLNDPFYTDICYDFDNPSKRDIPLSDRIATVYPDVSLCDEGCQIDGIDLENMTASCNCKFNDIANSNIIKDNALLESAVGEIFDIISSSNILVMKCYNYIFKHFTNSIGGMMSTMALAIQIICTTIYFSVGVNSIKTYIYNIFEKFLSFIGKTDFDLYAPPKKNIKNKTLKDKLVQNKKEVRFNVVGKEIEKKKENHKDFDTYSNVDKRKIRIEKPLISNFDTKSTYQDIIKYRQQSSKKEHNKRNEKKLITEKSIKSNFSNRSKNSFLKNKTKKGRAVSPINIKPESSRENQISFDEKDYRQFFDEYLATSLDDLEYDDAIILDKRTFCEYFVESLKERQMIAFTFIATDPLKIRIIKIMLFILNIVLYFVVIGLFFSEEYISELYNLEGEEGFFDYIPRSIDKFIYTTMVSIIIGYIIDCFFVDEKKIKGIFKREKDNLFNLKAEIVGIIKEIQKRYLSFIIIILVILLVSFYYLLCFNYVYPKTQIEWVKASLTIFVIMQILSALKCFLETCLRFLSFWCRREKIYKLSKFLD